MPGEVDVLVAGAGLAGAVVAERLAAAHGLRCLVVERRGRVGGMAHDGHDRAGVLVPSHGPHWFRTDSARVRDHLARFAEWRPVVYRVQVRDRGRYWQFPINLNTFEQLLGRPSSSAEMEATLARWRVPVERPRSSEELVLARVGRELYERFYRGYTRKMWGRDAAELDPSVCGRIPVRTDRDDRYLDESFQAMPVDGYTRLVERLLAHPRIEVLLQADVRELRARVRHRHLVYTGPVDELYDRRLGALPYRSVRHEHETLEQERFQPVMQVNYPNEEEFLRIVEPRHATGQRLPVTTIVREYALDAGPGHDPFYAVPTADALARHARYAELAAREPRLTLVGRLATYRNWNMDQVVDSALDAADRLGPRLRGTA